ncbi:hypothetical protein L1049_018338 [Liquidambar formosana]|uniref:Uncharacterized protein n=1 Tax=Liquidambar formosana TaxID=63359 RepID=A0AAP0R9Y4_LIQFO
MVFIKFMKKVSFSKLDDSSLITGLVTPPAAMAAKRAGEKVPQLNVIKAIPDVIFVPAATVLALISVKLSRRILLGDTASEGNQHPPPDRSPTILMDCTPEMSL